MNAPGAGGAGLLALLTREDSGAGCLGCLGAEAPDAALVVYLPASRVDVREALLRLAPRATQRLRPGGAPQVRAPRAGAPCAARQPRGGRRSARAAAEHSAKARADAAATPALGAAKGAPPQAPLLVWAHTTGAQGAADNGVFVSYKLGQMCARRARARAQAYRGVRVARVWAHCNAAALLTPRLRAACPAAAPRTRRWTAGR